MVNILLVHKEDRTRDQLSRFLTAGLGGKKVNITAVENAGVIDWRTSSDNFDIFLLEVDRDRAGVAVQYGRDILSSTGCQEKRSGAVPIVALITEAPLLAYELIRPQEEDIQVIGPEDLSLFGFYLGRHLQEGSSGSPIKFYSWLRQEGLDGLYLGLSTSEQRRRANDYLIEVCMDTDNEFLYRSPFEIIEPMLGSGCHKER